MKEANGESFGECVLCHVVGQGKKDFICANCGAPNKLMLVCQCGQRNNLTALLGQNISEYLSTVIAWNEKDGKDLKRGMTIAVSSCFFCGGQEALKKEAAKDLKIYLIQNRGFNV